MAQLIPAAKDQRQVQSAQQTRRSLAIPTLIVLTASAIIGLAKGANANAHRSTVMKSHVPGTNAVVAHICIAAIFILVIVLVEARRRRQGHASPWASPFRRPAWERLVATAKNGGAGMVRVVISVPLLAAMLYCPFRMGAQVFGGLDPNATINAWGGPTYAGAMAAHWLDCIVGFYAAAALLNVTLQKQR